MLGVDNNLISQRTTCSLALYDLIWFRDDYEKNLIIDSNLHVDNVRLQHLFGLEALKVSAPTSSLRNYEVAACFIQFYYLCTISNRNAEIPHSTNYTLILLGGTWEQWLQYDTISYEILPYTVHISDGRVGRAIELLVNANSAVYLFHDVNPTTSTIHNVLFPMVIAAQRTTVNDDDSARLHIHLVKSNDQLLRVLEAGCQNWNHDYFDSQVSIGLTVAHSLGVTSSRFTLSYIDPSINSNNNIIDQISVIFSVIYHDFTLGRDGNLCISNRNKRFACYTRFMQYVQINWNNTNTINIDNSGENSNIHIEYITFQLKGNIVGNIIYSQTCAIYVNNYMITRIECITDIQTDDIINPNTVTSTYEYKAIDKITEVVAKNELSFAVIDVKH